MQNKLTISNLLIIISAIFTLIAWINPSIYSLWINNIFLEQWYYIIFVLQFFTGTFLHGSFLHLLMNSLFIYYFWNNIEFLIWKKRFFWFFIFTTIFIWIMITSFTNQYTIWISWFAMALLTYYTLELYNRWNPEYKWWITALIINIAIWLVPGISLVWHFFWAIAWVIFYLFNKTGWDFIGLIKKEKQEIIEY